jgi:DNA-binding transcriptional LysR family regulator
MRFDYLETFLTVAENKSFTKAASLLFLSQTAVSFQIKTLEAYYSKTLFERSHHSVVLTDAGKLLQEHALDILKLHQETKEAMGELSKLTYGECFMGGSFGAGGPLLPFLLNLFHQKFPKISIHFDCQCCPKIAQALLDGIIGIAVITTNYLNKNLESYPLPREECALVSSPHCLHIKKRSPIEFKDLLEVPLVIGGRGCCVREELHKLLKSSGLGLKDLNIVMTVGSFEALKSAVKQGTGASVMPISSVPEEIKQGTLNVIKIKGFNLAIDRVLVVSKLKPLSHACQVLLNFLKSEDLWKKEGSTALPGG